MHLYIIYVFFLSLISGGISPRDSQAASSLVKALAAGKSTRRGLDRSFYRKWDTNQEKAWARMLKVGRSKETMI